MEPLQIACTRGGRTESTSLVDVAVVDGAGQLVASAGDPTRATWWRSAAKPFQAAACVRAGAADAFGFDDDALALACASHSGEPAHLDVARRMLSSCGCGEEHLACGGHPSLSPRVNDERVRRGLPSSPTTSNCSGKHAAMLALARHLGADVRGYERKGHPVQQAILDEVARATGLPAPAIDTAGDGCRAPTFFVPLTAMARAWARLGHDDDDVLVRLRRAMLARPALVAGTDRACTTLLHEGQGALVVKIGAEGVYCATLAGTGVALKVRSGDGRCAPVALCAVVAAVAARAGLALPVTSTAWTAVARPAIHDTRGDTTGHLEAQGALAFR